MSDLGGFIDLQEELSQRVIVSWYEGKNCAMTLSLSCLCLREPSTLGEWMDEWIQSYTFEVGYALRVSDRAKPDRRLHRPVGRTKVYCRSVVATMRIALCHPDVRSKIHF